MNRYLIFINISILIMQSLILTETIYGTEISSFDDSSNSIIHSETVLLGRVTKQLETEVWERRNQQDRGAREHKDEVTSKMAGEDFQHIIDCFKNILVWPVANDIAEKHQLNSLPARLDWLSARARWTTLTVNWCSWRSLRHSCR